MAKTPQIQALHDRLRDIDANEASATTLLRDKSYDLAMAPANATLRAEVEKLEAEIEQHQKERGRIEAAIHETQRRDSVAGRRERAAQTKRDAASVDKAGKRAHALAVELVAHIERMAPLLNELETVLSERRQIARAVLAEARPNEQRRAQVYRDAADWRRGVMSPVIAAALWRSGLGRLGADLEPWLQLVPPRDGKADEYLRGDLQTILARNIERADGRLSYGLKSAIESVQEAAEG